MKVYEVSVLWRTDDDWGSRSTLFNTKEKAEAKFKNEVIEMKQDYEIDDSKIRFSEDSAEYCTGDWDFCSIEICEKEVL